MLEKIGQSSNLSKRILYAIIAVILMYIYSKYEAYQWQITGKGFDISEFIQSLNPFAPGFSYGVASALCLHALIFGFVWGPYVFRGTSSNFDRLKKYVLNILITLLIIYFPTLLFISLWTIILFPLVVVLYLIFFGVGLYLSVEQPVTTEMLY